MGQQLGVSGAVLAQAAAQAPAVVSGIATWGLGDWIQLCVVLACLFVAGFASRAETSLTAINRYRARHLSEVGAPGSAAVAFLLNNPNLFLSSILIANTVAIIVASEFGSMLAVKVFGAVWGGVVSGIGISILVLVFCELIPKSLAIHTPEATALRVAGLVRVLVRVLRPLVFVFHGITSLALQLRGIKDTSGPYVTDEELIAMATVGQEQGTVEPTETVMIRNVFDFEETPVHRVMVPSTKVIGVEAETSVQDAIDIALEAGHSRLPVYTENLDHIVGVLYLKDLLGHVRKGNLDVPVTEIARTALQVPETKHVGELFRELQQKKTHMAILFDEYGATAGVVTIEDLLEEIVGEIRDEHDIEPASIEKVTDDEYIFDGLVPIEEANEVLDGSLEPDGYDTVGGFINDRLGRLAVVGDEVVADGVIMTVEALEDRRIAKVRVRRLPTSAATGAAPGSDT